MSWHQFKKMKSQLIKYLIIGVWLFNGIYAISQTKELEVLSFTSSDCLEKVAAHRIQPRVINQELNDGVLNIKISVCSNCCNGILGQAFIKNDTLILTSTSEIEKVINDKGEIEEHISICDCDRAFTFEYNLKTNRTFSSIRYFERQLSPHKNTIRDNEYKVINGDTLINIGDCYKDCYYLNKGNDFIKYCYYPTGELELVLESLWDSENSNSKEYLTIYSKSGNIKALILRENEKSFPACVFEWDSNKRLKVDTIRQFNDIRNSNLYKYLNGY